MFFIGQNLNHVHMTYSFLERSFLKDLPNHTIKKWNTLRFVKSGRRFSKPNNVSKSILHLASDWILLDDVKGDQLFPFQLALTELHPDNVLFSKSSKQAILLELTWLCEENMENRNSQKLSKYTPIAKAIEENGWALDLLKLMLGDPLPDRYYFTKRLGFSNKIV